MLGTKKCPTDAPEDESVGMLVMKRKSELPVPQVDPTPSEEPRRATKSRATARTSTALNPVFSVDETTFDTNQRSTPTVKPPAPAVLCSRCQGSTLVKSEQAPRRKFRAQPWRHLLVSRTDLRDFFGIKFSNCHLIRLERNGKFPRRLKIGNKSHWLHYRIVRFIKKCAAEAEVREYSDY